MLGIQNYFRMERIAFKCVGISLETTDSKYYKIYSICFFALIVITYPLIQVGDIFKHDFEVVTDILIHEFGLLTLLVQSFVVYFNRRRIRNVLDKLQQEPFLNNSEKEGEMETHFMRGCAFIVTLQTLAYWIICGIFLGMATILAIVKRIRHDDFHNWELPYGTLTVLNITYSPNYEITLIYQSISGFCASFQYAIVDSLMPAILCYITYQFKTLQYNIKHIILKNSEKALQGKNLIKDARPEHNKITSLTWECLQVSLKEVVQYHLAIIEIVNEVEDIFSTIMLVKFLNTLGMLCFTVYATSLMQMNDPKMASRTVGAIIISFHVFFVCFWGERMNHESREVGIAAYSSDFVGNDIKFQRAIILIIRRSQNTVTLTAGKFAPICLSTFAWVVRTSYSAFLVLRNRNKIDL